MGEADQIEAFTLGLRSTLAREVDLREPQNLQSAMSTAQKVELETHLKLRTHLRTCQWLRYGGVAAKGKIVVG
jgi:hypothetical protein